MGGAAGGAPRLGHGGVRSAALAWARPLTGPGTPAQNRDGTGSVQLPLVVVFAADLSPPVAWRPPCALLGALLGRSLLRGPRLPAGPRLQAPGAMQSLPRAWAAAPPGGRRAHCGGPVCWEALLSWGGGGAGLERVALAPGVSRCPGRTCPAAPGGAGRPLPAGGLAVRGDEGKTQNGNQMQLCPHRSDFSLFCESSGMAPTLQPFIQGQPGSRRPGGGAGGAGGAGRPDSEQLPVGVAGSGPQVRPPPGAAAGRAGPSVLAPLSSVETPGVSGGGAEALGWDTPAGLRPSPEPP